MTAVQTSESSPELTGSAPADNPGLWRRIAPKLLISVGLGALFGWLAQRGGVPLLPPIESFATVRWPMVVLAAVLLFVVTWFRATRWRFLIAPVKKLPLKEVLIVNWIGFFAIFALPLRLGELARPSLTKIRTGVPVSVGLGTVAVERVIDGLVTSLCVAWALWMVPRRITDDPLAQAVPLYGMAVLFVFVGALGALAAFLWKRDLAARLTEWGFAFVSPRLGRLLAGKVDSVADGIRSIGDARLAAAFLAETAIYWGVNACFMWVLGLACGLPMEFGHALAVMGVLALGILLPSGPGLFGNFQVAVSAALKLYFAEALVGQAGAVYIFLLYVLNALMMIAVGLIPLYAVDVRLRDVIAPSVDD